MNISCGWLRSITLKKKYNYAQQLYEEVIPNL